VEKQNFTGNSGKTEINASESERRGKFTETQRRVEPVGEESKRQVQKRTCGGAESGRAGEQEAQERLSL